jgi:SSS family solute:Na+ symporter
MNLNLLDWSILVVTTGVMMGAILLVRSQMRSVADFLAAGRTAGRYLLSLSQGMAGLGAITIVGLLEMNYVAGFSMSWWGFTMSLVVLIITVSGWVIYRFRQTRALTLAQFFEMRYSRNFRVFAGLIAYLSGVINFGIFPAVTARFFIYYCGLPQTVPVFGLSVSTFALVMIVLLAIALFFVFLGGQVGIILTDFAQGVFVNVAFIVIVVYLFNVVDWGHVIQGLSMAPENASLINPFKTSQVEDFNLWYFLIGVVGVIYGAMSWQGTQAYNASARSAHEAKMGGVLSNWRGFPQGLFLLFVPIVAYTVMHHPDYSALAGSVNDVIGPAGNEAIQSQLRTPVLLTKILPHGLLGVFAAVMMAAFITTDDTYLHSWGSIFVQDVVMPFRKKPLSPTQHLRALRLSILGVAVFAFLFSLLFEQSEYIFLFFAITGAIFAGGSGAVIIGGLYWRRGTTPAAWSALIAGSSIAVGGILVHQLPKEMFAAAPAAASGAALAGWRVLRWLYGVNGQQYWAIAMGAASFLYVVVSLLGKRPACDFDRLFHRGAYDTAHETAVVEARPARGWRLLGMGKEFTRGDKAIYVASYVWTAVWLIVFFVGTSYNLHHDVDDAAWARFWKAYFYIQLAMSVFVMVWFSIGGVKDIRWMLKRLREMPRDHTDDGSVRREGGDG